MQSILNKEKASVSHSSRNARVVQLTTKAKNPFHDKLIVPAQGEIHLLSIKDILYCQADSNYTKVVQKDGQSILTSQCLKHVLHRLSDNGLMRVHQSYAVPIRLIKIVKSKSIELQNGKEIPLSRQYRKRLIALLTI